MAHDNYHRPPALDAIYSRIPSTNCKGLCQECCGPIPIYKAEAKVLLPLTPAAAVIRDEFPILYDSEKEACPHLTTAGRCGIYEHRPIICRIWGAIKEMRCPHGCQPDRWMTDLEARKLMRQVQGL